MNKFNAQVNLVKSLPNLERQYRQKKEEPACRFSLLRWIVLYFAAKITFLRLEARLVFTDARDLGRRKLVVFRSHRHFHPVERDRPSVRSRRLF